MYINNIGPHYPASRSTIQTPPSLTKQSGLNFISRNQPLFSGGWLEEKGGTVFADEVKKKFKTYDDLRNSSGVKKIEVLEAHVMALEALVAYHKPRVGFVGIDKSVLKDSQKKLRIAKAKVAAFETAQAIVMVFKMAWYWITAKITKLVGADKTAAQQQAKFLEAKLKAAKSARNAKANAVSAMVSELTGDRHRRVKWQNAEGTPVEDYLKDMKQLESYINSLNEMDRGAVKRVINSLGEEAKKALAIG